MTTKVTDNLLASTPKLKEFVNFNGTGTPAIRSSMNISSLTDNGVGDIP